MHPHHISLVDTHTLRAKLHHAGDPYYNIDGLPSHHGVLAPKFDIFEIHSATPESSRNAPTGTAEATESPQTSDTASLTGWLVVGLLPGLDIEDIKIEWAGESTVFVRGKLYPTSLAKLREAEGFGSIQPSDLKSLHRESQEGPFERSLTLPAKADIKDVKVGMQGGVVFLRIPKKLDAGTGEEQE